MTKLNRPFQGVVNLLTLVAGFFKSGLSGIRKKFTRKDYIPVVYIKLKDLKIDARYQRLIDINFIKKAKEFKPHLVKPLSIFKRPNGDLFIVDGQHTACLAATYVDDPENFELPCQVQEHPLGFSSEECVKAEAAYFKEFNFLRNNVGTIAKLRADIQMEIPSAMAMLEKLEALEVHVQGIGKFDAGSPDNNEVQGYSQLKIALQKYGNTYVKRAVEINKHHISQSNWSKPLSGAMILGLTAVCHFIDNYVGEGEKGKSFNNYLLNDLGSDNSVDELCKKTAGVQQDVMIAENVISEYNMMVKYHNKNSKSKLPKIGMDDNGSSIWEQWVADEIHNKESN